MATQADVRKISLALPGAEQPPGRFAFAVRNKGKLKEFVWIWMERVDPKQPRVPRQDVVAIRVAGNAVKESMIAENPEKFFTEPHYNGFPAVLVHLEAVRARELASLLEHAWRCQAPVDLAPKKKKR